MNLPGSNLLARSRSATDARIREPVLDRADQLLHVLARIDEQRHALVRPRGHVVVLGLQLVVDL
ncbi:MAG TPA: hypothetical protein VG106_08715, partial [Vicinamibacterales bacterium]|nr:hypothetical protein [Vicinamibacterales bacterium]